MASQLIARPRSAKPYSLVICGCCREVRGRCPERGARAKQLCSCTPLEIRRGREPSGGADHCTYVELCRCCGLVLLESGSRWSIWFCEQCKPLISGLNRAAGRTVVPVGRHSVMNGVVLAGPATSGPAAVGMFARSSEAMFDRIGQLARYARCVVERNVVALGFAPETDVYVGEYLAAIRRSDLRCDDGFFALLFEFALADGAAA